MHHVLPHPDDLATVEPALAPLHRAMVAAGRSRTSVAALVVEVDDYPLIEGTLGSAAGELVLAEVAARLRRTAREGDTVVRTGGPAFVIICPGLPGSVDDIARGLGGVGRRIARALRGRSESDLTEVAVRASVGAAIHTGGYPPEPDLLLAEARAAMQRARGAGGGRMRVAERRQGLHLLRTEPVR